MLLEDDKHVYERFDDDTNDSLLLRALLNGYYSIANVLLINYADVNAKNKNGRTALMVASLKGHHKITKELLNCHANVNSEDLDGATPLIYVSYSRYYEIVKELLNHHADVNIQTKRGNTALICASKNKHVPIITELINHKADVNLQNSDGNTALHSVLLEKVTDTTFDIVNFLLVNKTNFEKVNKESKSVIQLARESENRAIIDLIEDFSDQKEIEAAKREFRKLQVNQIIKKRKRKLLRFSAVNNEVLSLQQKINQKETRNKKLEEELQKNREEIKAWQSLLKSKMESEDFIPYKKLEELKEENDYFQKCYETESFENVIQTLKRECPICFNDIRPNVKIYQCQSGHILCDECFSKIKEKSKICPTCKVNIASSPIRCRALEKVIDEEANE